MIDYQNLSKKELSYFGIALNTPKESKQFADFVLEELEVKIGERISDGLSTEKLEEFDMITDNSKAREWLETNRPDYRDIVKTIQTEMAWSLLKHRKSISNANSVCEPKGINRHVHCLRLTPYSYKCLWCANLFTIRDVIDFDNINDINGLDNIHAAEITSKIVEYLIP